ncbi:Dyp-type peroxidase [Sinirhodobacter populi]|uniref:Dyp-type peroxidase n=1 Tax=Paenirhodobacter populi TaxID=2306993 RepID=A0A443KP89_9RHOB|nr:Dyp-type peroxidase [Sinirhodobacter populi]RWR34609.1 Dyp-type peroxidase [Sinirhodobacter populi]
MSPSSSQPVKGTLTRSAIFVTLTVAEGDEGLAQVRGLCADLPSLIKAVGFRSAEAGLTCVLGIGAALWDRLATGAAPQGLHPFREISGVHHAPSTPGDLLLHVRAARPDYCFELVTHIMRRLGPAATVQDETQGFKFFDNRDLLGFVDGTENPLGAALTEAVVIGDEDPLFAGGSYVIVQKYLHDMTRWEAMTVEQQERIIGRHKLSDIEFADADKASFAHNVLTNIEDADGNQLEILRDNMPFGSPAHGEFGTYFIGYAREPGRIETMLTNMFVGNPPGNYDRILDVSTAVTGGLFFVPPADMLDTIAAGGTLTEPASEPEPVARPDSSLGLGSLKRGN